MIGSLIKPLLIVWGAVTVAFAIVMLSKSFGGERETDVVILDAIGEKQAQEQRQMIARVQTLAAWAKGLGIASLALLLLVGGLSVYSNLMTN